MGRHKFLCSFEILYRIELNREKIGRVGSRETISLWYQTFEGLLIEYIYLSLLLHHRHQFCKQGSRIVGIHFLDTHRLTNGISNGTYLANLLNPILTIYDYLDLLVAQLMVVDGQRGLRLLQ